MSDWRGVDEWRLSRSIWIRQRVPRVAVPGLSSAWIDVWCKGPLRFALRPDKAQLRLYRHKRSTRTGPVLDVMVRRNGRPVEREETLDFGMRWNWAQTLPLSAMVEAGRLQIPLRLKPPAQDVTLSVDDVAAVLVGVDMALEGGGALVVR